MAAPFSRVVPLTVIPICDGQITVVPLWITEKDNPADVSMTAVVCPSGDVTGTVELPPAEEAVERRRRTEISFIEDISYLCRGGSVTRPYDTILLSCPSGRVSDPPLR